LHSLKALLCLGISWVYHPEPGRATKNPFGTAGKAVLDVFNPEWSQKLMVRMARFGLAKDDIETIFRLDVKTELIEVLPRFLATDLNEAMAKDNAPPRIVLFFDTHEAFWGENRSEAKANYFFRDEWLRLLLRKLNYEAGIVAVVAGRDKPRWAEARSIKPNTDIPEHYLDTHRVGNLSAADALAYLEQPDVGIADTALCQSLIAYASVEPGEVHPLHLGLCADVVVQAQAQGTPLTAAEFATVPAFADKSKLLVERLLKYVSNGVRDGVYALSACRAFDKDLYRRLGQALNFASYDADFELITRFSFVKQLPEPRQDWYRLHGLLRRLTAEDGNKRVIEAHRFLEQHYRDAGQRAEAIYHANQLNPHQGIQEWISTFDEELKLSRYQNCEALLEVRRELRLVSYFQLGSMSRSEGDYYQNLARYPEAEQEYLEAIWAQQQSLKAEGDDVETQNNLGNALQRLGDLQSGLSQHGDALSSYERAIAAYDQALGRAPDDINALNNKGKALQRLGDLQSGLSQHSDALSSYERAIAAYDQALGRAPDDIYALNNKGNALVNVAQLQGSLEQSAEAQQNLELAVVCFSRSLALAPNNAAIRNLYDQIQAFLTGGDSS
jgi:tetratricopeptide (TPR) repeat protein